MNTIVGATVCSQDEPKWVSLVPETYTKPNQTKHVQDCALATSRKVFGLRGGCWPKHHAFLQGLVWGGGLGCLIIVPPQHQPIIKCGAACPTMGLPPYLQVVQKYCRCNKTSYLKKKIKSILNGNGLS